MNREVLLANLQGNDELASNAERLALARVAMEGKMFAAAAKLWAEALENDPGLCDDPRRQYRYDAACAAALAAAGQGLDEQPTDDAKAKLRHQALDWLTAELTARTKRLESSPPQDRPTITKTSRQWLQSSDLAGIRDAAALARLPAEERKAFAQFWANVAHVSFPDVAAFIKRVANLSSAEQVDEVRKELKELNPGFDGALTPTIENDAVTGLKFTTDLVMDISPVRALTRLVRLELTGSDGRDRGSLADLTPLSGIPLIHLEISGNPHVDSLSALRGMPLKSLWINNTHVSDLQPLVGMPLTDLGIQGTSVTDLSPLKDLPLFQIIGDFQETRDATNLLAIKSLTYIDSVYALTFWEHGATRTRFRLFCGVSISPRTTPNAWSSPKSPTTTGRWLFPHGYSPRLWKATRSSVTTAGFITPTVPPVPRPSPPPGKVATNRRSTARPGPGSVARLLPGSSPSCWPGNAFSGSSSPETRNWSPSTWPTGSKTPSSPASATRTS